MILIKKKYQSSLNEAFLANNLHENYLLVKASDRDISVNYQALTILSPYFRNLMASSPCCAQPTLLLPEFSASSIELFISMVTDGTTKTPIKTPGEAAEIIKVAKAFDIDASDYTVVVSGEERQVKQEPDVQILEEDESYNKEDAVWLKDFNTEIAEQREHQFDLSSITPSISLDESTMSQLDASFGPPGGETSLNCQVCYVEHNKLSLLLIHYIHAHFMKEARSEFRSFASNKTCNICSKDCKSSQQLYVHIGVKHKKINSLLVKHGYKEHTKPVKNGRPTKETHTNEVTTDLLATSLVIADVSKTDFEVKDDINDSSVTKGKKSVNSCQLCEKEVEGLSFLWNHYTNSHFHKDIKQSYGHLMDFEEMRCKLCDKQMKQKQGLLMHVGTVHQKVNEVLVKYGLNPLEVKNSKLDRASLDSSIV